jgi:hypothetical protein
MSLDKADYNSRVFLNVPFDRRYERIFRAIVFAVHDCGFQARCALESDDGGEARVDKILRIVSESRLGIHDISRTQLDRATRLPRFNMPLELGLFLGAKKFGNAADRQKAILILDSEKDRYQKFCSDISGQDIRVHGDDISLAIKAVRNWLQAAPGVGQTSIPSWPVLARRYAEFRNDLRALCRRAGLQRAHLTFIDHQTLVVGWLQANQDWRAKKRV